MNTGRADMYIVILFMSIASLVPALPGEFTLRRLAWVICLCAWAVLWTLLSRKQDKK